MGDQLDALCAMFEGLEREVVAVVLESCGQNMDRAIDQLLQIGEEQQAAERQAAEAERARLEQQRRKVEKEQELAARARERAKWRKPIPDDFLRIPSAVRVRTCDAEQIERDQLIARLLADEGFRRQLAQHDEFRGASSFSTTTTTTTTTSSSNNGASDDFDWAAAWQGLTGSARVRFEALATKFSRSPEYQAIASSGDDTLNAMFPSGGTTRARNKNQRGGSDNESGTEMQELGSMSRMKIQ